MSNRYTISDIGLRLIKAYEGYASNGHAMRGDRKLVGYGRVTRDLSLKLSESEAEALLLEDLSEIENLVNTNVFAAMNQSQFDALCSLAYSIGTEAFLKSDVLHALNRGEIIGAANAFDGWRLGNIDGHIYVVDALVRRRTAEKALFLRPTKTVPAPHEALKAMRDDRQVTEQVAQTSQSDRIMVPKSSNIISLYDKADQTVEDMAGPEDESGAEIVQLNTPSPIAEAAAEVSERLDALMDDDFSSDKDVKEAWPESLTQNDDDDFDPGSFDRYDDAESLPEAIFVEHMEPATEKYIEDSDGFEASGYASADKYIESQPILHKRQNFWAYITMVILGLTMGGAGLLSRMNSNQFFGDFSRLAWSAIFAIGVLMLIMGLYYLFKQLIGKS